MRERPILFSGPMVRAILDDRKTMTRRVAKFTASEAGYNLNFSQLSPVEFGGGWHLVSRGEGSCWTQRTHKVSCPYGIPGDRLWVREAWYPAYAKSLTNPGVIYRADYGHRLDLQPDYSPEGGWRPSIHMPRWASRLTLEVTAVRVERLQEITERDAEAEGFAGEPMRHADDWPLSLRKEFRHLWDALNAKRGYGWDANPWVWVIEFRRSPAPPAAQEGA